MLAPPPPTRTHARTHPCAHPLSYSHINAKVRSCAFLSMKQVVMHSCPSVRHNCFKRLPLASAPMWVSLLACSGKEGWTASCKAHVTARSHLALKRMLRAEGCTPGRPMPCRFQPLGPLNLGVEEDAGIAKEYVEAEGHAEDRYWAAPT